MLSTPYPVPPMPQLTAALRAVSMPAFVHEQILDIVLAKEIERLDALRLQREIGRQETEAAASQKEAAASQKEAAASQDAALEASLGPEVAKLEWAKLAEQDYTHMAEQDYMDLPDDDAVREVVLNGAFEYLGLNRRGQGEFLYRRQSRDGKPLTGREAKNPPAYKLTTLGDLVCFCSCPCRKTSGERDKQGGRDKHVRALTWSLTGYCPPARTQAQEERHAGEEAQEAEAQA